MPRPPQMSREQFEKFSAMLLGPPRADPGDIYIRPDGEPEWFKETDPAFFRRPPLRPRYEDPPKPEQPGKRRSIPASVMREVLGRDGCECYLCGATVLMDGLHYDHIIPVSRGGENTADNIGVTCATCNLQKGDRLTDRRPRKLRDRC